jgi:hypothetical protein
MHEFGIGADRDDFGSDFFESFILLRQSSKFRGSDEGEVGRIEEQNGPLFSGFLRGERELVEISLGRIEGFEFEVRHCLTDSYAATLFRHGRFLPVKS